MDLGERLKGVKDRLRRLWDEEAEARNQATPEPIDQTLERHREITEGTNEMVNLKRQQAQVAGQGGGSPKVITGDPEYGEPPPPNGRLQIKKVAFATPFDVCSDDVANFSDYRKFYVLEDGGKYYHWLRTRTNADDANTIKPHPIPITFASTETIELTATFEVISPTPFPGAPTIRVRDMAGGYTFAEVTGQPSGEFEVTFTAGNLPYENTARYQSSFSLQFDYSEDGATWQSAGASRNTLYLTWRPPLYARFNDFGGQRETMKVKAAFNGNKRVILESLLKLSCEAAHGVGNATPATNPAATSLNEESVLDAIFTPFQPLLLKRAREGTPYLDVDLSAQGLGYWRNVSSLWAALRGVAFERGLRGLLRHGEARCGEFCDFFFHTALAHGASVATFWVRSAVGADYQHLAGDPRYANAIFLVKGWAINDPGAPVEVPSTSNKAQGNNEPMHFFWDHIFTVYQVGNRMKYYDPSYGLKAPAFETGADAMLNAYAGRAFEGILYVKRDPGGQPFVDVIHSQQPWDVLARIPQPTPFLFRTITANPADHLVTRLSRPNSGIADVQDASITFVLP